MPKLRPGSLAALAKESALEVVRKLAVPEEVLARLVQGRVVAEFRLDHFREDLEEAFCSGRRDEPLDEDEVRTYTAEVMQSLANREILTDDEDTVLWVCWDPVTEARYLVPADAIKVAPRLTNEDRPSSVDADTDLGEAEYLFPSPNWHYV